MGEKKEGKRERRGRRPSKVREDGENGQGKVLTHNGKMKKITIR